MNLKDYFQENLWASASVLLIIVISVGIFLFFRINNTLDEIAEDNPDADFFGKIFGQTWGRIVPFLLLIGFIILSWFLTKLYQK